MIETGLQNTMKDRNIRMLENTVEKLEQCVSALLAVIGELQPQQDIEDKEMNAEELQNVRKSDCG